MKRYNFELHPNENPSLAIVRVYKHIRSMKPDHKPKSLYAARIQSKRAMRPILRLVK